MKIQSSSIVMSGTSSQLTLFTKAESLKTWKGSARPNFEGSSPPQALNPMKLKLDILELSEKARKSLEAAQKEAMSAVQSATDSGTNLPDKEDLKIQAVLEMIRRLTGKRISFLIPDDSLLKKLKLQQDPQPIRIQLAQPVQRAGWGLEYDSHVSVQEQEKMTFSSQGVIKTADGKEINFSVDLSMSREFAYSQDISLRAGDAVMKDPLVINFNGAAASLTQQKFSFDLDADGKQDQISFTGAGSGFLALDLNLDGKINDGGELFGPQSGDGFSELARYDTDGNHWIDENDAVYDKLRIWTKDENGDDKLFALGEKGIGAIYLGNVDTQFGLKDGNNETQGEIRNTGIFVRENGSVGTIQHIDLAV